MAQQQQHKDQRSSLLIFLLEWLSTAPSAASVYCRSERKVERDYYFWLMPSMPKSSPQDRKPTREVNLSSRLTSARLSLATEPRERCLMRFPKYKDDASCSMFPDATFRTESQSTQLQTFHPPLMTISSSSSPQNRSIRGSNPSRSSSCNCSNLPNFWSSTSPSMQTNSCVILLPQSSFTSLSNPARSPYWSSTPAINFLRYGVRRVFLSRRASRRLSWVAEESSPQQQKIFPSQKTASSWTGRARQCLRYPTMPCRSRLALCWQSQRSREVSKCVHWLQEAAKEGKGETGEGPGVRRALVQRVLSWFLSSQNGSSSSTGRSQRSLSNIMNRQLYGSDFYSASKPLAQSKDNRQQRAKNDDI